MVMTWTRAGHALLLPCAKHGGGGPPKAVEGAATRAGGWGRPLHHAWRGPPRPLRGGRSPTASAVHQSARFSLPCPSALPLAALLQRLDDLGGHVVLVVLGEHV